MTMNDRRFVVVRHRTDGTGDPEIMGFVKGLEHIESFLGGKVTRFKAPDGTVMYDKGEWDYVYGVEVVVTNDAVGDTIPLDVVAPHATGLRKKVLLGLSACTSSAYDCDNCPYGEYTTNCVKHLMRDALVTLTTEGEK